MPFVIDLSKELTRDRLEKVRDLVVRAISNDSRFSPNQRMSIVKEVIDTLNDVNPKTYEELISALDMSIPRKKGYIPDAKRFVVELLAKDAGVQLDPKSTQVKFKGNLYSLYNEPGQRTLRSGFIDKAGAADELMTPLSNVLKGVKAEPLGKLSPLEEEAMKRADEDLAARIARELEKRGKRVVEAAGAPAQAPVPAPPPPQLVSASKTPEAELAQKILQRVGAAPAAPAAFQPPQQILQPAQAPLQQPKPPNVELPPAAQAVKPPFMPSQAAEMPPQNVLEPPSARVRVEELKLTPQEPQKPAVKRGIEVTKSKIESVLKGLERERGSAASRIERIAEEVLKKLRK